MTQFKAGQRVRIVVEGTISDFYSGRDTGNSDSIAVDLDRGIPVYVEVGGLLDDLSFEIIPEPLKDGLYYNADSADEPFTQMSLMYKLEGGQWYNSRLDVIDLSAGTIAGMVRVGPVDS